MFVESQTPIDKTASGTDKLPTAAKRTLKNGPRIINALEKLTA